LWQLNCDDYSDSKRYPSRCISCDFM
jgi:hypothetical protein